MLENAWIVAVPPMISWILITLFNRRLGGRAAYVAVTAVFLSMAFAVVVFVELLSHGPFRAGYEWIRVGDFVVNVGFQVDQLTGLMLVMISTVSSMVQLYSMGYMAGDTRYQRYFGTISLFTFAMLGLVLADNFIWLLVMWEIMGLCSYLLIGHWFEEYEPQMAAMKAFLTTRVGDVAMMVGVWLLFASTGTFDIAKAGELARMGGIHQGTLTVGAVLLFGGAVGKSAQFPLHVWLPDAMAGPTPVSALIHAATMVAAGVYLVSRTYQIFALSAEALLVVAVIGGFTALFAATIATVMTDFKKVLAYSTISQLGYMMLGLGVGAYAAGVFHLLTHAFFKALLFLCSGSVIHALHTQEMHQMGGLSRKMRITFLTYLIGAGALAGIPPLSGFWSKDEILAGVYRSDHAFLFWFGLAAAAITAYYITRATFLVFLGKPRDVHVHEHAHESPLVMTVPLIVLATLAVFAGLPATPLMGHWIGHFLGTGTEGEAFHIGAGQAAHAVSNAAASTAAHAASVLSATHGAVAPEAVGYAAESGSPVVMCLAISAALIGILAGYAVYGTRAVDRGAVIKRLHPVYLPLKNKYYVDELYYLVLVRPGIKLSELARRFDLGVIDWCVNFVGRTTAEISKQAGEFDLEVIDGVVNGVANGTVATGRQLRKVQTGYVQAYMMSILAAAVIGLIILEVIGG